MKSIYIFILTIFLVSTINADNMEKSIYFPQAASYYLAHGNAAKNHSESDFDNAPDTHFNQQHTPIYNYNFHAYEEDLWYGWSANMSRYNSSFQFRPQLSFDIAPPITRTISPKTWQTYHNLSYASHFVQQNKATFPTYQNVCKQLDRIAHIAQQGNTFEIAQLPQQLAQLATAYDSIQIRRSEGLNTPNAHDQKAVKHLQNEIQCVTQSLCQELFDKHGAFIGKPIKNFGKKTIEQYKKQYIRGTTLKQFNVPNKEKERAIRRHGLNSTLKKIDYYYTRGNIGAANEEINSFLSTKRSARRYGKIIKSFCTTHPSLNELEIPKICEINPNWPQYAQALKNTADKAEIIDCISHEQMLANEFCRQAGIKFATPDQLRFAFQCQPYQKDPYAITIARKGFYDNAKVSQCLRELDVRAEALKFLKKTVQSAPPTQELFNQKYRELLTYAHDPQFEHFINMMTQGNAQFETGRKTLAFRQHYVTSLKNKLKSNTFYAKAAEIAYDLSCATTNQERLNVFKKLCNNSDDFQTRAAYNTYYNQDTHLPITFNYDQHLLKYAKQLNMPRALGSQYFINERTTYAQVMLKPIVNTEQRAQAEHFLRLLLKTTNYANHSNGSLRDALRSLCYLEGQIYLNDQMQTNPNVLSRNIKLFNDVAAYLQENSLAQVTNHINRLQKELKALAPSESVPRYIEGFLEQHSPIYIETPDVQFSTQSTSEQITIASSDTKQITHSAQTDFANLNDYLKGHYQTKKEQHGSLSAYHQSRLEAVEKIASGDTQAYTKGYNLNQRALKALQKAGKSSETFTQFKGNHLQHDTHNKLINALNRLAQNKPTTQHVQILHAGAVDCAYAGNACNQHGMVQEAMIMTDMCQMATDTACGVYDGVIGAAHAWWHSNNTKEPTLSAAQSSQRTDAYQLAVSSAAQFTEFILSSAENAICGLKGLAQGGVDGIQQVDLIQNAKDICSIIGATAQRAAECSAHIINMQDDLDRGNFERARAHAEALNESLGECAHTIGQTLDSISDGIDRAIQAMPKTPKEWQQAGHAVSSTMTKNGLEMYLTGKCLQGISTITKGIGYRVAHLDQTAKELKIAHGLSGNPMPKSTMPKTNIVNTVNNPTTPIATSLKSMQGAGDVISNLRSNMSLQNSAPVLKIAQNSASSSNLAQKVAQTAQAAKQFLAQTQPGYIDLQKSSASSYINLESVLTSDRKKIDIVKLDLDNLPLHLYDESICSGQKLQEFVKQFKDTPGAMGKDGPLQKLLEMSYIGANQGNFAAARGALYELEVAQKIILNGGEVIEIGQKIGIAEISAREFDIITTESFIECKNIDWSKKVGRAAEKMQSNFGGQLKIAQHHEKKFIVYSKKTLPHTWKKWLSKKKITVIEG